MTDRLIDFVSAWGSTGRLCWIVAWQSTMWLALGLVAARVWRQRASRAHWLLLSAALAAILAPGLTLTVHRMQWGVLPAPSPAQPAVARGLENAAATPAVSARDLPNPELLESGIDRHGDDVQEFPTSHAQESDAASASTERDSVKSEHEPTRASESSTTQAIDWLPATIVAVWAVASFVLLARLIVSLAAAARMVRESHPEIDARLLTAFREAADALGLSSVPRLQLSPLARCPMIWCWSRRPALLLPEAAAGHTGILWRSVFCHELAHLIRRDHWSSLGAELLIVLVPWQPLAWLSRRRLAQLREQACDDWVLSTGAEAPGYAQSLLQLAPQSSPIHALAAVSSRRSLKRRLEHVLSGTRIAPHVGGRWVAAATLLGLASIAGVAFAQQGARSPVRTSEPAPQLAASAAAEPQEKNISDAAKLEEPTRLHGTVLRPDGQPAVGATVSLYRWKESRSWERVASTQSDGRGEFEIPRPPSDEVGFILATAESSGFDCRRFADDLSQPLVMHLVADEPIRGRVLDLEGHPVAGARVDVLRITDSRNRSLGPWLTALQSGAPRIDPATHALLGPILSVALANNSWNSTIPGLQNSTKTDGDGRFTLRGLGAERVIDLAITSDRSAYRLVTVATLSMPPIVRAATVNDDGGLEVFGADFTTSAKPTSPVVGTVRDAKTAKPLEGVRIESWRLADEYFFPQRGLETTSDAQGRYRLVGLPKGRGNVIRVVPNDDQPYFMRRLDVPDTSTTEPVTLDIELSRGLWISGRVTDKETGKPVRAHLNYWPLLDNPFAKERPGFGPGNQMVTDQYRWPTHADGTFRIPGLPGRGVVGAETNLTYRQGAGAAEIPDADRGGELRTYRDQRGPSRNYPASMKEISPHEGSETVVCDLVCDHGETVKVTVLDPEGEPARHLSLSHLTKDGKLGDVDSPFELYGLSLSVANSLLVEQKERKLSKLATFTLTAATPRSLTIKLEPWATVTGRLLDEQGVPIKGATVEPLVRGGGGGANWVQFPSGICKDDGRFECPRLPAGASFSFLIRGLATTFLQGFGKVDVEPGKTIDLGDIRVHRRGVPKTDFIKLQKPASSKTRASSETKPEATAAAEPKAGDANIGDGTTLIRGTVLQPDGKPAAGAKVLALRRFWSSRPKPLPIATAIAGLDGSFELQIPRPIYDGLGSGLNRIAARADGFGTQWAVPRQLADSKPPVLSLVPEAPIHGRIVDGEGQPVAGVRVRVREQTKPMEGKDLGPWLEAVKTGLRTADSRAGDQLPAYDDDASPPIVSDADGRFTVPGVGAERLVRLELSGETIATARIEVVNREMMPIARTAGIDAPIEVFGKGFTYHASPTRPIVGTVRDADTGKPLAGVRVESEFRDDIRTRTDEQGRFRLVGLPSSANANSGRKNQIKVVPGKDQPYFLMNWIDVPQPAGHEPVTLDVKLRRGLWITGRVTDKVTGKPVLARVHYFPYTSNPFITKNDWGRLGDFTNVTLDDPRHVTRPDGSYRVLGLPGRGIVGALALGQQYRKGVGASEIPGMAPDGHFPTLGSPAPADARREDALKEINPAPGTESVTCDLALDPGGKVRLTLVDPAGKPVEDSFYFWSTAGASSSTMGRSSQATFDLAGMNPTESRTYVVSQVQRKIAKLFTLDYEDKPSRTLTITLEPSATVQGRLVDEKGAPLRNVEVRPTAIRNGRWLLDFYPFSGHTDGGGHFVCDNLAVGCDSYKFDAYWERGFTKVADRVQITPGKTIDLGEVKLRHKQ